MRELALEPWRVVEAQHLLGTRDLVDSIEEHALLEDMLENSKPQVIKEKNYLLFTPFRYPPLKYGSRFGSTWEPSLWYGSLELATAFAEVAHYRFLFLQHSTAELGYVDTPMTAFCCVINSTRGIDLTSDPFDAYRSQISDKNSYEHSQNLGSKMRADQVQVFLYYSARSLSLAKNVAAFEPEVFAAKNHKAIHQQQTWRCLANRQSIEFTRLDTLGKKQCIFTYPVDK